MLALPPEAGATHSEEITGISCPDCPGVLAVSVVTAAQPRSRLRAICPTWISSVPA